MANGTLLFAKVVAKAESSYAGGTDSNLSTGARRMTVAPTGVISIGREYDTGADRTVGIRSAVIGNRVTQTAENPEISIDAPAVTTDDLAIWFGAIEKTAGGTPTGTAAPYTWTRSIGQTSSTNAPASLHAIVADGNQSYYVNGILPTSITIGAEASGLTTLSGSFFAKSVAKTAVAPDDTLPSSANALAGRLWQLSYGTAFLSAGTSGGTAFTHLYSWSLEITSGFTPINAQAGALTLADYNQFGAGFGGALTFTVASNATAVAQLFDKLASQTFWRLHWQNSGNTESVDILLSAVPTSVTPIGGDQDGITTYEVELALAYDATSSKVLEYQVKNGLSALP
jgi:hypothetical protein